jgi:beta-1,4-mannosyl-glycoprotein beta-1,4-N-acetylglucosaminyltransferase
MFFNELELLKMRFEELDSVVDHFVLVECAETQRGNEKPFYFAQNRHLFEKYLHKIIHIIVDERHPEMQLWERENFQRSCIERGLKRCKDNDVIMISDLDEIPRSSIIAELKSKPGYQRYVQSSSLALQMSSYFYQLNRQMPTKETWHGGPWVGTTVTSFVQVRRLGVQYFRDQRYRLHRVLNAGWHFTWMGGKEQVRRKYASVVEGVARPEDISDELIEMFMRNHPAVLIDETFPAYVRKNEQYLRSIGYIADY